VNRQVPDGVVLDGELVILGADGRLSFDALQQRLVTSAATTHAKAAELPASFAAFDLLAAGGVDLRTQRWRCAASGWSRCRAAGCCRCS
jgi:ATP-dependent DNA ligase